MKFWLKSFTEEQRHSFCGMPIWDIANKYDLHESVAFKLKKISISIYGDYGNI